MKSNLSRSQHSVLRQLPIECLSTDADLISDPAPLALFGQSAVPDGPGAEPRRDCLQRENFRVEPRVLDLMRQVLRPSLREFRLRFQAAAQVLSRDGPCRGVAFGAGVAMIAIRIDGGLREDRACASALQDQGRAVLLVPHQMNGSPTHEMHQTNSVAQVKYRRSGGERAFVPLQAPKERIEFRGHDRYHV